MKGPVVFKDIRPGLGLDLPKKETDQPLIEVVPTRAVSPQEASTSLISPFSSRIETSKVPPPRS